MRSASELFARLLERTGMGSLLCFDVRIAQSGKPVTVPLLGGLGYGNLDRHEIWMTEVLSRLLDLCPGTFLDVGANVGQTLIKVKALDPDRAYVAVEPNPSCAAYLETLVAANQYRKCRIVPAALAQNPGIAELHLYDESATDASASMIKDFRKEHVHSTRRIVTCSYAEIAKTMQLEDIAIVKIDVEGAEWEVLQSLENLLRVRRPVIIIEILPVYTDQNKQRFERQISIEKLMREMDYKFHRISKSQQNGLAGITPVSEIGIHGDLSMCDYITVPRESENEVCKHLLRPMKLRVIHGC